MNGLVRDRHDARFSVGEENNTSSFRRVFIED
jgi:hypothetical protein